MNRNVITRRKWRACTACLALLAASMSSAAPDFSGFWQTHCGLAFGISIERLDQGADYSINFCGPGGCSETGQYRPVSTIVDDPAYRVVNANHLMISNLGGGQRYFRCNLETRPVLAYPSERLPDFPPLSRCRREPVTLISADRLQTIPQLDQPLVHWVGRNAGVSLSASDLVDLIEHPPREWPPPWQAPSALLTAIEQAARTDGNLRAAIETSIEADELTRLDEYAELELPLRDQAMALAQTLIVTLLARGAFSIDQHLESGQFWKVNYRAETEDGWDLTGTWFRNDTGTFWEDCVMEPGDPGQGLELTPDDPPPAHPTVSGG